MSITCTTRSASASAETAIDHDALASPRVVSPATQNSTVKRKLQEQLDAGHWHCDELDFEHANRYAKLNNGQLRARSTRSSSLSPSTTPSYSPPSSSSSSPTSSSRASTLKQQLEQRSPQHAYACVYPGCDKSYKKPSRLASHELVHTNERPFKCPEPSCTSAFRREDHLVIHTKIHGADREFQCEQPGCSKAFYTKSKLLRHLKSHSYIVSTPLGLTTAAATSTLSSSSGAQSDDLSLLPDGKGRLSRRSSLSAEALQRVAGQLEKEKPHMCTWEGCTQRFSQRKKLRAHICVAHEGRKPYPCTHEGCGISFQTPSKLRKHQLVHNDALRYCCGVPGCGKFFSKWSMLQKHTKECHQSMPCAACGKMILKRNLNAHMKIHDASRLVAPCTHTGCNKVFSTERTLATHLQKAHDTSSDSPPTFTCEYKGCGMGFQYKHVLKRHIDRVHEKPKQKKMSDEAEFEDVLDDMFGFAEADIAIRTPFACPIPGCERRFTSERLMKRHLQGQEHRSGKVTGADIVQSLEDDENQAIRDMIDMHLGRNSGSNSTTS